MRQIIAEFSVISQTLYNLPNTVQSLEHGAIESWISLKDDPINNIEKHCFQVFTRISSTTDVSTQCEMAEHRSLVFIRVRILLLMLVIIRANNIMPAR